MLDPIVAIRRTLGLAADETATVQIISGVADSREAALALLDKYCDRHFVERAFEMAWFQSQEVLRHLNASEADAQVYGRLAASVIYGNALRRAAPGIIARNQRTQSGLWRFGISGDLPIVLAVHPSVEARNVRERSCCCTSATSTASAFSGWCCRPTPTGA